MMATIALAIWPLVSIGLFAALGTARGLIWSVLVGYLFLPEAFGFDLPGLPPYDKYSSISISALLGVFLFGRNNTDDPIVGDRRLRWLLLGLAAVVVITPFFTMLDNRYSIPTGLTTRKALGLRDVVAMVSEVVFGLIPFFLARRFLYTEKHHTSVLIAAMALGIVYAFLALFEIRMSPQLNRWIYGYFPHSWVQHLRGGFRPLVFLEHGLWLGFFLFTASVSAFALSRQKQAEWKAAALLSGAFIFGVLLISRNLGASMLALIFIPVVLMLTVRLQAWVAVMVAVLFLSYPFLRQAELVPINQFADAVAEYSPNRARSFQYRMNNEDELLARAAEKPVFGWGIWARAQLFNERGIMVSVADGIWIIFLGERGWVGYLSFFGLLTIPIFYLGRAARRKRLSPATCGVAAVAAGNLIYMIPNATLSPVNMLFFGALAGFVQFDSRKTAAAETAEGDDEPTHRKVRYTRFEPGKTQTDDLPLRRRPMSPE